MAAQAADIFLLERAGVLYKIAASEMASFFGSGPSGVATITIPSNLHTIEWVETVAAIGVAPGNNIICALAKTTDADENQPELLDIVSISAIALTDAIIVYLVASEPTEGPIKIIWKVV